MAYSQSSVPSDWRIYFDLDPEDDMAGQLMFDSRITPSLFDSTSLTFTPNQDIDFRNDIYWSVQAINDSMYGGIVQHRIISFQIRWEQNCLQPMLL